MYIASPPDVRISVSTCLPSSSRISPNTTFAPSCSKSFVSVAPCPLAPPLIYASLASSRPIRFSFTPCTINTHASVSWHYRTSGLTSQYSGKVLNTRQSHTGYNIPGAFQRLPQRAAHRRAACRNRGPQPPAAGGERPQAACKMAFDLPIRQGIEG